MFQVFIYTSGHLSHLQVVDHALHEWRVVSPCHCDGGALELMTTQQTMHRVSIVNWFI